LTEQNSVANREKFDAFIRQRQDILTMPWIGATLSIGAYALVLAFASDAGAVRVTPYLTVLLGALGCGFAAASILLPRRACSDAAIAAQMRLEPQVQTWAKTLQVDAEQLKFLSELAGTEQRLIELTLMFRRPYLLALALAHGVALAGLAYGLLSQALLQAVPFLIAALALNGLHYPRLAPLLARGRKLDRPDEEMQQMERTLAQMKQPADKPERRGPHLRRGPSRPGKRH
jgi:hypothetical protein